MLKSNIFVTSAIYLLLLSKLSLCVLAYSDKFMLVRNCGLSSVSDPLNWIFRVQNIYEVVNGLLCELFRLKELFISLPDTLTLFLCHLIRVLPLCR